MKKLSLLLVMFVCVPSVFATETEREVLRAVLIAAGHHMKNNSQIPAVLASETRGGAELYAKEWALKNWGKPIGLELGDSYVRLNSERHSIGSILPGRAPVVDLTPEQIDQPDWEAIDKIKPGAKSLVILSYPAFDSLSSYALVRSDFIERDGRKSTAFYRIERQADGAWKFGRAVFGSYDSMHDGKSHVHAPEDNDYYHSH